MDTDEEQFLDAVLSPLAQRRVRPLGGRAREIVPRTMRLVIRESKTQPLASSLPDILFTSLLHSGTEKH